MQNGVFEKGFKDMMARQDELLAKQTDADQKFGALRDWAEGADQRLAKREREASAAVNGDFAEAAAQGAASARSALVGGASPLQTGHAPGSDDDQPPPPPTKTHSTAKTARQTLGFEPQVPARTTPGGSNGTVSSPKGTLSFLFREFGGFETRYRSVFTTEKLK